MRAAPSKSAAASNRERGNRSRRRRRSAARASVRAPASTSMITGSVTAIGPSVAINSVRRRSTALPVARSYSTQADVSARIMPPPRAGIRGYFIDRAGAAHGQGFLPAHGLSGQVPEGELDGFGLGPQVEAVHYQPEICLLDLDIRTHPGHTPTLHLHVYDRCTAIGGPEGVSTGRATRISAPSAGR